MLAARQRQSPSAHPFSFLFFSFPLLAPCLGEWELTCFRDHAAHPWTEMVHFADAETQFPRVMRTIRLPQRTIRAPPGTAVAFARKDVFAVKGFEAGTVGIEVWRRPGVILRITLTLPRLLPLPLRLPPPLSIPWFLSLFLRLWCGSGGARPKQRDDAWIALNGKDDARIRG